MSVAKNMDSVFTDAMDDDFDVIFDQEDSLIDTVNGVNESGDPLTGVDFDDLHQTDDADDDILSDDQPMGVKNAEGTNGYEFDDISVKGELNKDSDADKLYGDAECDYHCDKTKEPSEDPEDINGMIDKVVEDVDAFFMEGEDLSVEDMMDDDDDDPIESCKKESVSIDDFEDEIANEAGEVDADVADVDKSDIDDEDDVIDAAAGNLDDSDDSNEYDYDYSDEELIDIALNN